MGDAADDAYAAYWEQRGYEDAMSNSDAYIEFDCVFKHATRNAVLIAYEDEEHWISRSLLSYTSDMLVEKCKRDQEITISVREWRANQIGVVY